MQVLEHILWGGDALADWATLADEMENLKSATSLQLASEGVDLATAACKVLESGNVKCLAVNGISCENGGTFRSAEDDSVTGSLADTLFGHTSSTVPTNVQHSASVLTSLHLANVMLCKTWLAYLDVTQVKRLSLACCTNVDSFLNNW